MKLHTQSVRTSAGQKLNTGASKVCIMFYHICQVISIFFSMVERPALNINFFIFIILHLFQSGHNNQK